MEMIASAAISFVIIAVLLKIFIPILKKAKLGQKILEIGPNWHKSKEGTPTMGGLFFMIGIIIACAIMCITEMKQEGIRLWNGKLIAYIVQLLKMSMAKSPFNL